jgi:flagellar protein FlaI
LQLAEVDKEGNSNVIMQYNVSKQEMNFLQTPRRLFDTITLYTGMSEDQIRTDLEDKKEILQWLVSKNINDIHKIGSIMAHYYLRKYTIQNNDS